MNASYPITPESTTPNNINPGTSGSPPPGTPGPAEADNQPGREEPSYHHRRTGTVACLPKAVRDQICQMLRDGFTYKQVIAALGEPGKDLKEDHIRRWNEGGYNDWLANQARVEALNFNRDRALDLLEPDAGPTVQNASRTIAAAQLYELPLSFNPTAFGAALSTKPELYLRLINCISRLSEGEAACSKQRARQPLNQSKLNPEPVDPENIVLSEAALKAIAHRINLL